MGSEQGKLDVLVNNAFTLGPGDQLKTKFWEQGVRTVNACDNKFNENRGRGGCEKTTPLVLFCFLRVLFRFAS